MQTQGRQHRRPHLQSNTSYLLSNEECDQQVETAREDIKKELSDTLQKLKKHEETNKNLEQTLNDVNSQLVISQSRVHELEGQTSEMTRILDETQTATELAVSEMQQSKTQAEEAWEKIRQLENENILLTDKIKTEQTTIMEKWQEVMEMEEMVQRSKKEVENIRSQLIVEREIHQDTSITSFWRRKQHPYAKRLAAYARLVENGDMAKVIQALDVLLMEMKDNGQSKRCSSHGHTDDGFFVLNNPDPSPAMELRVPSVSHEAPMSHQGGCTSSAASLNATLIATGGVDRQIYLWDPALMSVQSVLKGMMESVRDVAFNCNGEAVLAAGADKCIRVWKTASASSVHTLTGHSRCVNCISCDPSDPQKAVSSGEDRCILFWDLHRGYRVQDRDIRVDEWTNAVSYTSTGNLIVSGHSRGGIKLWDVRSSESCLKAENVHEDAIVAVCPMPSSSDELLCAGKDNRLTLFDFRALKTIRSFSDSQFCIGTIGYMGKGKAVVGVSQDGQYVSAGTTSGCVMVWKADNSEQPKTLTCPFHSEPVVATTWANERMFSCDRSGNIVIWR